MKYTGGKNHGCAYPQIINRIPPHRVYVEPFLGSGAILRMKRPAEMSYGLDQVPALFPALRSAAPNLALLQGDGITFLEYYPFKGDEFVYCDPPYLLETRAGRRYYKAEMSDADHLRLLAAVKKLPCPVMLSGYPSRLYDDALSGWRRETFRAWTRTHQPRTEVLWMNYPQPLKLHDDRYLGANWRARWNLERRRRRLIAKFTRMPTQERSALLSALVDVVA